MNIVGQHAHLHQSLEVTAKRLWTALDKMHRIHLKCTALDLFKNFRDRDSSGTHKKCARLPVQENQPQAQQICGAAH